MALFDGYFDPQEFAARGGLLGRLMSLQQQQGQYQPGAGFDQQPPAPLTLTLQSMPSPMPNSIQMPTVMSTPEQDQGWQFTAQAQTGQGTFPERSAPESPVGAINSALTDFYRQTILQAGKDVAGYMTDAVNDPISFAHAITPSLAALGPITSEIPTVLKGVTRLVGSPIIPENQDLVLNNKKRDLSRVPSLPETLIGNNPRPGGKRARTDLPGIDPAPEELFDRLTGGQSDILSDGTRLGSNGIRLRPDTGNGPRIDIPANGEKQHETIHFPGSNQ